MGIFFGFCNTKLRQTGIGNDLAHCICYVVFLKDDIHSCKSNIIWGHGAIIQGNGLHIIFRHILLGKCNGDLLCPVISEIKKDNHISFLDLSNWFIVCIHHNNRLNKFVCHSGIVGFLDSLKDIL